MAKINTDEVVNEVIKRLSDMQDITKVVRCKDCKWMGDCYIEYHAMFRDFDYCSRGKRKDGESNLTVDKDTEE